MMNVETFGVQTMAPMVKDQALRLLAEAPVAHIGFVSDGAPYITPITFVLDDERILFRTRAGKKLDALRHNPNVCIEVSRFEKESGKWASVIVTGTAAEVGDGVTGALAVAMLYEKYADTLDGSHSRGGLRPVLGLPHVIEVTIDEVTGLVTRLGFIPRIRPSRL